MRFGSESYTTGHVVGITIGTKLPLLLQIGFFCYERSLFFRSDNNQYDVIEAANSAQDIKVIYLISIILMSYNPKRTSVE